MENNWRHFREQARLWQGGATIQIYYKMFNKPMKMSFDASIVWELCYGDSPLHPNWPNEQMIEWHTDRPIDRLTDWPTDRLTDWTTDQLKDWQTERMIDLKLTD